MGIECLKFSIERVIYWLRVLRPKKYSFSVDSVTENFIGRSLICWVVEMFSVVVPWRTQQCVELTVLFVIASTLTASCVNLTAACQQWTIFRCDILYRSGACSKRLMRSCIKQLRSLAVIFKLDYGTNFIIASHSSIILLAQTMCNSSYPTVIGSWQGHLGI